MRDRRGICFKRHLLFVREIIMKLLAYLEKHQKKRKEFSKSEDYLFYSQNRNLLAKLDQFSYLSSGRENDFRIIRANIIIHGMINKAIIESEAKNLVKYTASHEILTHEDFLNVLKQKILTRPYIEEKEGRIYIPFFSKSINSLYFNEPEKLNEYPYTDLLKSYSGIVIDPFDTYGAELYNTHFTRLVRIASDRNVVAYFHYDTLSVYIINDQGRLDSKIVLFDRYMKKITTNHMLERIRPVIDSYFKHDFREFLKNLEQNGFISTKMLFKISHKYRNLA